MTVKKTTNNDKKTQPAAKTASALTMADLLADNDYELKIPKPGDVVTGTVVSVNRKMVVVDIGAKTEGLVVDKEYQLAEDLIADLKPGDKVDVYVLEHQGDAGQLYLSLKKATLDKMWDKVVEIHTKDEPITVKSIDTNRGGMVVVYEGVRGFIPTSQFGRESSGKLESLKGKELTVKILEVDKDKGRFILSERLVSEEQELANAEKALSKISPEDVVEGVITGIKPFGIFVAVEVPLEEGNDDNIGVLEGLVHISEISWDKIDDLNALFQKGQRVKAKVLAINEEHGKLTLSIKQLQDDPWDEFVDKFPAGTTIQGTVSKVVPFGVFVTISPGVEGLIHESKLEGATFVAGDKVSVVIDSVDTDQHRVRLSLAATDVPVTYK